MRQILVFAVLIAGWVPAAYAQTVPDPEFSLRPYAAGSDSTLQSLERAQAQMEMQVVGMGYGGANVYYTAFTPASEVRFSGRSLPKFVMKSEGGTDPAEQIVLCKGEVRKKHRRFVHIGVKMYGGARDVSSAYVKLEFKRIREGVFEIMLPRTLPPGEYAFMPLSISTGAPPAKIMLSCFGID
ncbi:MAG: hypothetical protein NW241_02385 [Bacteroidia bacterium]|nr:hypothetical protein [Bacteroidia bacterium]